MGRMFQSSRRKMALTQRSGVGEEALQFVTAADALLADEDERVRADRECILDRLYLVAGPKHPIVDVEAVLEQKRLRADAERTGVLRQDHAIQRCGARFGHRSSSGSGSRLQDVVKAPP